MKKKFGVRNTGSFKKKMKKLLNKKEDISLPEKSKVLSTVHEDVKTIQVQEQDPCDSEWTEVKKKNKQRVQTNEDKRNRMCNSISTGEPCKHGENCCFAHNWDELVVSECRFGSECKHVKKQSEGVYTVVEGKYCKYKHPKETNDSVCVRFGMPVQDAPKVNIVPVININPKQPRSIMKESVKHINLDSVKETIHVPVIYQVTKDNDDQEVVIRVQKELAVQAIELVVKAGKNKIRVELI